jgi:prepilin-type N-terminal cleavage/methylation domain-containing protein
MKLQRGFSALELIMAMAVSAIIMTCLLEIYNQVSRNMLRVERFVFEDTQILTLRNRFGKDLSGLSAIWFTQADIESKQSAVDGQKAPTPTEKKKTSTYFYSVNKNKNLDTLTFVTTNALQSYGSVQDRFVRILYKVEQDPVHAEMFRLMRKEIPMPTENIDEETLKPGKFYELVSGIKSLEMTYQLIDKVELQKQSSAKVPADGAKPEQAGEKKPIIRSVKQWTSDAKKSSEKIAEKSNKVSGDASSDEEEKQEDLGGAAVPKFVEMKIVFGATGKQLEKEYKLEFYIPSTIDNLPQALAKSSAPVPTGSATTVKKGAVAL